MKRRCIEAGCPALTTGTRCGRHEKRHRAAYGGDYPKRRRAVLGGPCTLQLPGCTGIATTADHVIPNVRGGAHGPLRGACAHCNSSRKDGNAAPGGWGVVENFGTNAEDPRTLLAMSARHNHARARDEVR